MRVIGMFDFDSIRSSVCAVFGVFVYVKPKRDQCRWRVVHIVECLFRFVVKFVRIQIMPCCTCGQCLRATQTEPNCGPCQLSIDSGLAIQGVQGPQRPVTT